MRSVIVYFSVLYNDIKFTWLEICHITRLSISFYDNIIDN